MAARMIPPVKQNKVWSTSFDSDKKWFPTDFHADADAIAGHLLPTDMSADVEAGQPTATGANFILELKSKT